MRIILFFAFLCLCSPMFAQGYFDSASTPADNGSNATATVTVTPPAGMADGYLVVLIGQVLTASTSISVSVTGGQSWNDGGLDIQGTGHTAKVFWCRFNGTWTANPELTFGASNATSAIMHVFIPSGTASKRTWGLDQAGATATYSAPGSPFSVTRAGQTTVKARTVMLQMYFSVDDNTWAYSAGAYNLVGSAQYRNTADTDMSALFVAQYFPFAGSAGGNGTYNQNTNGGDDGATAILTWYDYPTGRGIPYWYLKY
jgi:hypothetical protein